MDWFADEEFWREFYPAMFPPARLETAGADVAQIVTLTGIDAGSVLDLCCGPGRHSVAFARLGFSVTGVDRSTYLLEHARAAADQAGLPLEWVQDDMRSFVRPGSFELACNLFTSFGYFATEEENFRVLENVFASLKPAGVFVMEMLGKERLARFYQGVICTELGDGALWIQRPTILRDWTRIRNEWVLVQNGAAKTFRFEHSIYSGRELRDWLLRAGFANVRIFGDLAGSSYGVDALRLVAVAHKA